MDGYPRLVLDYAWDFIGISRYDRLDFQGVNESPIWKLIKFYSHFVEVAHHLYFCGNGKSIALRASRNAMSPSPHTTTS